MEQNKSYLVRLQFQACSLGPYKLIWHGEEHEWIIACPGSYPEQGYLPSTLSFFWFLSRQYLTSHKYMNTFKNGTKTPLNYLSSWSLIRLWNNSTDNIKIWFLNYQAWWLDRLGLPGGWPSDWTRTGGTPGHQCWTSSRPWTQRTHWQANMPSPQTWVCLHMEMKEQVNRQCIVMYLMYCHVLNWVYYLEPAFLQTHVLYGDLVHHRCHQQLALDTVQNLEYIKWLVGFNGKINSLAIKGYYWSGQVLTVRLMLMIT